MDVYITRAPIDYKKAARIDVKEIESFHWSYECGGTKKKTADTFLYGYIPYKLAADIVDCSGAHEEYGNNAKICILKGLNERNGCQEGYDYCVAHANNERPKSCVSRNRPQGAPPCTKAIIRILEQQPDKTLTREELRNIIINEKGYLATTFRSAIKSLTNPKGKKSPIVKAEGSSLSSKQKLTLVD